MYFSIHRFENGDFWPNLRESSFDYIGEEAGTGYNINVPLNETGMGDAEYMAIFQQILLPVAYEVRVTRGKTRAEFYNKVLRIIFSAVV